MPFIIRRLSRIALSAAVVVTAIGIQIAAAPAEALLAPYDMVSSPVGPPVTYEVRNPHSAVNPVAYFSLEPIHVYSPNTGTSTPIHAVFSQGVNSAGQKVAVADFYHDGPADAFPMNSYLALYVNMNSPIAASEISSFKLEDFNVTQQTGFVTMSSEAAEISMIRYEAIAVINPLSNLKFRSPTAQPITPNQLKQYYYLEKTRIDALVDPSQPLFRVEIAAYGVPEPSSVTLAATSAIGLLVYACRRRGRSSAKRIAARNAT